MSEVGSGSKPVVADSSAADKTVFAAIIHPHRSLSRGGTRLVITLVAVAGVVSSIPFMIVGAWPVAGYFGLDLLLLYVAFRVNRQRAASVEEVQLTYVDLFLRKVSHRGAQREWHFNPAWVRIERQEDEDFGLQRLEIVSGGTSIDVAGQLSPSERADFARAFEAGLIEARKGPKHNSNGL